MIKRIFAYIMTVVTVALLCSVVYATDINQLQNEKSNIDSKLTEAQQNKAAFEYQYYNTSNELTNVISTENAVRHELQQNEDNIKKLADEINDLSKTICQTEEKYNQKLNQLESRLRVMYRNSNVSKLDFLLKSGNISEFFQRARWLARVFSEDRKTMSEFSAIKKDLDMKKCLIETDKKNLELAADQKRNEVYAISISRASVEERLRITKSNLDYWTQVENQFAQKSKELEQIIMNLSGKGDYAGGGMVWPTPGYNYITQYYGTFIHPILGDYRNHFALDIGAPYGASIVASNSGTVISCGWIDGYGNTVIIDHGGGISTLYAHASTLATYHGAYVERGTVIAYVGSTGLSTGPHLHFEVRVNGVCVDPLGYVTP